MHSYDMYRFILCMAYGVYILCNTTSRHRTEWVECNTIDRDNNCTASTIHIKNTRHASKRSSQVSSMHICCEWFQSLSVSLGNSSALIQKHVSGMNPSGEYLCYAYTYCRFCCNQGGNDDQIKIELSPLGHLLLTPFPYCTDILCHASYDIMT